MTGGGGSTSTTTVDTAYNDRMATLAEEQQAVAMEYFQFWEDEYKELEQAYIDANLALTPLQTQFTAESLAAQMSLITPEADFLAAQFNTDTALEIFRQAAEENQYTAAAETAMLQTEQAKTGIYLEPARRAAMEAGYTLEEARTLADAELEPFRQAAEQAGYTTSIRADQWEQAQAERVV